MFPSTSKPSGSHLRRFDEHVDLWEAYDYFGRDETVEEEMRHITQEPDDTPKETFDRIEEAREEREDAESALDAIYRKDGKEGSGELAGDAVLKPKRDRRAATLGVWLRKRFWGRGYSGERAAALVELAFDHLDLDLVAVEHEAGNENSRRAIEKYVDHFGGRHEALVRNGGAADGRPIDVHRYSISRAEYRSAIEA